MDPIVQLMRNFLTRRRSISLQRQQLARGVEAGRTLGAQAVSLQKTAQRRRRRTIAERNKAAGFSTDIQRFDELEKRRLRGQPGSTKVKPSTQPTLFSASLFGI